jgi:hypothetical protein
MNVRTTRHNTTYSISLFNVSIGPSPNVQWTNTTSYVLVRSPNTCHCRSSLCNKLTRATNGPDEPIVKPWESEDLTDIGINQIFPKLFRSRPFKSGCHLRVRQCQSTSADVYQIFFEVTRCTCYSSSQNKNFYLGTGFSIALSKSLSRLDLCGVSPCCPSTLIMDCAVESRSQRVSTVTSESIWLIGVGAEGFRSVFVILPSYI